MTLKFKPGDLVVTDYHEFGEKLKFFDRKIYKVITYKEPCLNSFNMWIIYVLVEQEYKDMSGDLLFYEKLISEDYLRLATEKDLLRIELEKLGKCDDTNIK